ncbi:MAG: tetratricopeptide repeat protein [Bradymonadales bacterium]|nr:tetratricopeptide repeat protein [Bradymonadales bacterium]
MSEQNQSLWEHLKSSPADTARFLELKSNLMAAMDWRALAELYALRATAVSPYEASLLHLSVAEKWARELGDQELVRSSYDRALQLSERVEGLRELLGDLFWKKGFWPLLETILEEDVRRTPPGDDRGAAYLELARFRIIKLDQPKKAAEAYLKAYHESPNLTSVCLEELERLNSSHPANDAVNLALQEIYRNAGRYQELHDLLLKRLDALGSDLVTARFSLLMTLTRVAGRDLARWDLAVAYLEQATQTQPDRLEEVIETAISLRNLAPQDIALMRFLQGAWEQTDHWPEALEMIQAQIRSSLLPSSETAALQCRAGEILWHSLDRRLEAIESFNAAATMDEACLPAVIERYQQYALEVEEIEIQQRLEEALQDQLYRANRTAELLALWQERLEHTADAPTQVQLLFKMGDLLRTELADPKAALDRYTAASERARTPEELTGLMERLFELRLHPDRTDEVEPLIESVAERHQRWDDLFYLLTIRLEQTETPAEEAAMRFQMARLLETRLSDVTTALEYYQVASELDRSNRLYVQHAREAFARAGRWDSCLPLFDREMALIQDPGERISLNCQKAQTLWTRLDQPAQAVGILLTALLDAPQQPEIRQHLVDLLRQEKGLDAFEQLLEETAEQPGDTLDLPHIARAMSALLLGAEPVDLDRRWLSYLLAIDRYTTLEDRAHQSLLAALNTENLHEELFDLLMRRAGRLEDIDARRAIYTELLALCRDRLHDDQRHQAVYWQMIEDFPDDWPAIHEFIALLETGNRIVELDQLYRLVISRSTPEDNQQELLALMEAYGRYQHTTLHRPDLAVDTYRLALDLDPLSQPALEFFREIYGKVEDLPTYFDLLASTLLQLTDPSPRSDRLAELGQLAAFRLSNPGRAIPLFEEILATPQANPQAMQQAFDSLMEIYRRAGRHQELLDLLRSKAERAVETETKVACLLQVADLLEELDRLPEMLATLDEVLKHQPDDLVLLERAADMALQIDDAQLELKYTRAMIETAPQRTDLRLRAARILAEALGDREQAIDELLFILEREPANPIVLDLADENLSSLSRFTQWRDLLVAQVERAPDQETRVQLLLRLADAADMVGPGSSEERDWRAWALGEVIHLEPERTEVAETLVKHLEDMGQWAQAVELAESLLNSATVQEQRLALLRQLGSLHEHQLDQLQRARQIYQEILELVPEDAGAHRALLRIAEKSQDFQEILHHTRRIVELEPLANDLAELVTRAAEIAENQLGDQAAAVELYNRLVELDPLDKSGLEQLARLLEATGDHRALAEVWDRLAALADKDQQRADLWLKKAILAEETLGEPDRAAEAYQDILRLQPANRLALNALKRIYSTTGRWQEVLNLLERLAQLDPDPHIRGALWREAAQVYEEQLSQPEMAFDLHRRTYELLDDETTSIRHLRRLAEQHDLWEPYIQVLLKDMQRGTESAEKLDHLIDAAHIMADQLGQADRAFDLLYSQFEPAPRQDELFATLSRMASRHHLWDRLEATYTRLVRATLEPEGKVKLYHQLAEILSEQAELPIRALAVLKEAYLVQPAHGETLARMELLANQHELWEPLEGFYQERWDEAVELREKIELLRLRADILENKMGQWKEAFDQLVVAFQLEPDHPQLQSELIRFARQYEQWETLIKLFDLVVKERPERAIRMHLLVEMARIAAEELGSPDRAFEFIGRAWKVDTSDEMLRGKLEQYANASGRLDLLADAYEWDATNQTDPLDRFGAWIRLAELCTTHLLDVDRAVRAFTEAFRIDPDRLEPLQSLEDLLISQKQEQRLLATLTEWAAYTEKPEQGRLLFHRIARLAERLGLKEGAVEAYRGVLSFDPNDLEALLGLAHLHREAGDLDRVARCLSQAVPLTSDQERRGEMMRELADLYTRMERYEQALQELERVAHLFPGNPPPVEQLVDLYLKVNQPETAINLLESKSQQVPDEQAGALLLQATLIAFDLLVDPRRASRLCNRAVRKDPNNTAAWLMLIDLCEETGRWRDQVDAYRSLAELSLHQDEAMWAADKRRLLVKLARGLPEIDPAQLDRIPPPRIASLYLALAAHTLEKGLLYTDQALKTWLRATEVDPDWPVSWLEIARLTQAVGRWEEAQSAAQKAVTLLEQWPASPLLSQAWSRWALSLEHTSLQMNEVLCAYESALSADPGNRFAQDRYHALLAGTNQLSRANQFFARLLKTDLEPTSRRAALVAQAHLLKAQGDTAKSAEALLAAIQLGEQTAEISWELGDLLLANGQHEHAVGVYSQLLTQLEADQEAGRPEPGYLEKRRIGSKKLAQAAELAGQLDLAQQHFTEAHSLDPSDPEILVGLARLALARGAAALANHYVDEVLSTATDDLDIQAQAMLVKAEALQARGNLPGAIVILEQVATSGQTGQKQAARKLADLHIERAQWDKAYLAIRRLLEQTPPGAESAALSVELADLAWHHLNLPEEAWDLLVRATAEDPGNLEAKQKALALSVKLGRWKIGSELAESLLPRLPEPDQVVRCRLLAAEAAAGHEEYQVAMTHYVAALRLDPHNREILSGLIDTARRSEDWYELRQQLEAHLERLGPSRCGARDFVLSALLELLTGPISDSTRAVEVCDEIIEHHPDDIHALKKKLELTLDVSHPNGLQAVTTLHRLALLDELDLPHLRTLRNWYLHNGYSDRAFVLTSLLELCQAATEEERKALRRTASSTSKVREVDALTGDLFERAVRFDPPPTAVLTHLAQAAAAAVSDDYLRTQAELYEFEPLDAEFKMAASVIGLSSARLRFSAAGSQTRFFNAPIPQVHLDANLLETLEERQLQFELAYLATLCLPEYIMCSVLSELDYVGFHEAALEPLVGPDDTFGRDEAMDARVRGWRILFGQDPELTPHPDPGKQRGLQRSDAPNPSQWRDNSRHTAARVGLLICDDLGATMERLFTRHSALNGKRIRSPGELVEAMKLSVEVKQLVAYLLSDACYQARQGLEAGRLDFELREAPSQAEISSLENKAVAQFELEIEKEEK